MSNELPEYMIPTYFIYIDSIPLTPNGKVDRKALPKPDEQAESETEYAPPSSELEEKLVKIWQEIFETDKIGVNQDFFELGGNSILAIRFEIQLDKAGVRIEGLNIHKNIHIHKTIKEMAAFITQKGLI